MIGTAKELLSFPLDGNPFLKQKDSGQARMTGIQYYMEYSSSKMKNLKIKNSIIFLFSFLFLIFFLASCGKQEVKKTSDESKIAQEVFRLAEVIKDAYIKNDRLTLEKNSTKDGYQEIIEARKSFDSAELTFTPRWVEIEYSAVNLHVSWNGTWTIRSKKTEDRGLAVFVFEGKPLKLAKVLRANPFKQPE
jgi:hypothetical protein